MPKLTAPAKEASIYINKRKQRVYAADNTNFYIYSYNGTLLHTYPHGVVSIKTGIVAEHDRVGVVDFES
ncbi:MAG: hypothetical protein NZZ41_02735 [Candidatus Dojkabacteria bacterium]|nr:hypothetical protein [Candidatus Dojkabacteria bacterium]